MQSFPSSIKFNMKIHGVRHPIYRNGHIGKQDEQGWDGKCVKGLPLGFN